MSNHHPGRLRGLPPVPPTQQGGIDPRDVFGHYFGLGMIQLSALQPSVVPCMCGKCQGIGVQLEVRMHFPRIGPPELIRRGDAAAAAAADTEPPPREGT